RQAIVLALQIVVVDHHILAFDVTGFTKPLAERGHIARKAIGRPEADEHENWHCPLLRPHHHRPRRCAPEPRDELPPSDHWITSSAVSRIDCGTVSPRALAVLRFTTISNFVGNCTGRSPGFAPRRMRST